MLSHDHLGIQLSVALYVKQSEDRVQITMIPEYYPGTILYVLLLYGHCTRYAASVKIFSNLPPTILEPSSKL